MRYENLVSFLLRIGLSIVFLYAATAAFLEPLNWIGFSPQFIREIVPAQILLFLFSLSEIILALWLVWGRYTFYAASLAALTLFLIILSNLVQLDIVFRDLAIFFSALALAILSYGKERGRNQNVL